jgi:hypothetical protein
VTQTVPRAKPATAGALEAAPESEVAHVITMGLRQCRPTCMHRGSNRALDVQGVAHLVHAQYPSNWGLKLGIRLQYFELRSTGNRASDELATLPYRVRRLQHVLATGPHSHGQRDVSRFH